MTQASDDLIDATSEPIQAGDPAHTDAAQPDPTMATVVALANELQKVYAHDQQKLEQMNRSLRGAVRGTDSHKH